MQFCCVKFFNPIVNNRPNARHTHVKDTVYDPYSVPPVRNMYGTKISSEKVLICNHDLNLLYKLPGSICLGPCTTNHIYTRSTHNRPPCTLRRSMTLHFYLDVGTQSAQDLLALHYENYVFFSNTATIVAETHKILETPQGQASRTDSSPISYIYRRRQDGEDLKEAYVVYVVLLFFPALDTTVAPRQRIHKERRNYNGGLALALITCTPSVCVACLMM